MSAAEMHRAIQRLTLAVNQADTQLKTIDTEISSLHGRTCTGTIHWRHPTIVTDSAPMMYANHKHGESCPIHGTPKTDADRLRVYIGKKPDRQEATLEAIALHKHLLTLIQQQRTIWHNLNRARVIDRLREDLS